MPQEATPGPTRHELAGFGARHFRLVMGFALLARLEYPDDNNQFYKLVVREMEEAIERPHLLEAVEERENEIHQICLQLGDDGEKYWKQYQNNKPRRIDYSDGLFEVSSTDSGVDIEFPTRKKHLAILAVWLLVCQYHSIARRIREEDLELWKDYVDTATEVFPEESEKEAVFRMTKLVMKSALVTGSLRNLRETVEYQREVVQEMLEEIPEN